MNKYKKINVRNIHYKQYVLTLRYPSMIQLIFGEEDTSFEKCVTIKNKDKLFGSQPYNHVVDIFYIMWVKSEFGGRIFCEIVM